MFRCILLSVALLATVSVSAAESPPVRSERAEVRLLSEVDTVAPGKPFRVALHQRLAPGWHTYWSNPGDAGQPPEMVLDLPDGATAGPLVFPAPHRLPYGPLVNFGYEKEAAFTMEVTPPANAQPGDAFVVRAEANWLVCEKICIPEEGRFSLRLAVGVNALASPQAPLFTAAEAAQPRPSAFAARIGFEGKSGAIEIAGEAISPESVRDAFFFPAEWGIIENAAPQSLTVRQGGFVLALARGQGDLPAQVGGIVAITDGAGTRSAYQVAAAPGPVPKAGSGLPLWHAALWAVLGGLILNLMPCVFPILAMKALSIARLGGAARAEIRGHAAAYTAGIVVSFVLLGGLLAGLKAGGLAAGWGFQFTAPAFVAGMAWLMLAIGLNLSGVYAVGGPVSLGEGLAGKAGRKGAFATGVLAVLVATPCTAPFMAAAIGAALAMPPAATLLVFGAMGLGMALPHAMLGIFPGGAAWLPRPGAWMERLRQLLAFPMYATAAWLVWVLAAQAGADGVLFGLAGGVLVALAAWILGQMQAAGRTGRRIGGALAGMAVLAALALLPPLSASDAGAPSALDAGAESWSEERVRALQAAGRPVFVNLTASWCISCKVNEQIIRSTAVQEAFEANKIAYLVGDWTRGDAVITALLRRHGREGVPLYLVYPAGGGAPAILPQILTEGIVLRSLPAAKTVSSGMRSSG